MHQIRRLYQLWTWIPAFRAVAETQHLPTASDQLRVSASSLSRAVKQLEEELGTTLFVRTPRGLELTDTGERLLVAVREGMGAVGRGVAAVEAGAFEHQITIATSAPFARELVLPAARLLRKLNISTRIQSLGTGRATALLGSGAVDLIVSTRAPADPAVVSEPLMTITQGIYCGPSHPLFDATIRITIDDLLEFPFVGPPPGIADGWPPDRERKVVMTIAQLALAIDACADGDVLGVMPDLGALQRVKDGGLRRLPIDFEFTSTLYVLRRAGASPDPTRMLLDAIRSRAGALEKEFQRSHAVPSETVKISHDREQ